MPIVNKSFSDLITFTRSTGGGRFNAQGQYEWLPANTPRIDYDPVTGECRGLLIEEQRTNRRIYSSNAENWSKNSPNLTAEGTDIPAPLAGECFQRVSDTGSGDDFFGFLTPVPNNTDVFTGSIYVRKTESSAVRVALQLVFFSGGTVVADAAILDTNTGSVKAALPGGRVEARDCGDTWRLSVTLANNASGNTTLQHRFFPAYQRISSSTASIDKDAEGVALVYGAQLEAGSSPSSYIPTTTAQVTRAADIASVNELSPWFNPEQWTLFVEASTFATGECELVGLQQDIWNGFRLFRNSIKDAAAVFNTGDGQGNGFLGSGANGDRLKVAGTYSDAGYGVSANGRVPNISAAARVGFSPSHLVLGRYATGLSYLNGHIKSVKFFPRRLSDAELQALTA